MAGWQIPPLLDWETRRADLGVLLPSGKPETPGLATAPPEQGCGPPQPPRTFAGGVAAQYTEAATAQMMPAFSGLQNQMLQLQMNVQQLTTPLRLTNGAAASSDDGTPSPGDGDPYDIYLSRLERIERLDRQSRESGNNLLDSEMKQRLLDAANAALAQAS